MLTKRQQVEQLHEQGHTNYAEIARHVGVTKETVWEWLGCKHDSDAWELERQRHAAFFNGMTPKQEYSEHIKRRNAQEEKI